MCSTQSPSRRVCQGSTPTTPQRAANLWMLCLVIGLAQNLEMVQDLASSEELIVPVQARASSNSGAAGTEIGFHVDKLLLGARHYDPRTGSNAPYGLMGFHQLVLPCVTATDKRPGQTDNYPLHQWYQSEPEEHPKHQGMWLTVKGDCQDAWAEFELPAKLNLGRIVIWNWADGPEIDRRAQHITIQTSTTTTVAGSLGQVDYNVTHTRLKLPDIRHVAARGADLVYQFPPGTRSRYVRLGTIDHFGTDPRGQVGLAEVLIFAASTPATSRAGQSPRSVAPPGKASWHLFLDNHVIERSTGLRRILHHPKSRGVVLTADQPWESNIGGPMYVGRRQDGRLECYYRSYTEGIKEPIGYAISEDGLHWKKPILGLVEAGGSNKNNLVPCSPPVDLGQFGNVTDPDKRFLVSLGSGNDWRLKLSFGKQAPDFLNDPDWKTKFTEAGRKPSYKLALHFWDNTHQDWVFMRQTPNHPPTRSVARWSTRDLQHWTLRPVLYPDAEDSSNPRYFDEVYGMHAIHAEGLVLGYGSWFMGDHTRPDMARFEQDLIGRLHMKGPMDVRVLVSRDGGFHWDRTVSREAWIPHGTEHDSADRCVILYTAPVRMGDEDWFYCNVMNGEHGAPYQDRTLKMQSALYVQKHNRYTSLSAHDEPQILITRPIKVTGKTLQLNVDASRGEVTVGIGIDRELQIPGYPPGVLPNFVVRDRQGNTHQEKGYRLTECQPIRSDCIEHNVHWNANNLESLLGKTVRLYIRMRDSDLYGFRFR